VPAENVVDGEVEEGEKTGDGGRDSSEALQVGFVALDALLDFLDLAPVAVADKPRMLALSSDRSERTFCSKSVSVQMLVHVLIGDSPHAARWNNASI